MSKTRLRKWRQKQYWIVRNVTSTQHQELQQRDKQGHRFALNTDSAYNKEQDRQYAYNLTFGRVRVIIVIVEKQ